MIYRYEDIRTIHLEITDKCNASCPMCARNKHGGEVNQWLPLTELSINDCKKIFPVAFIKQLNKMYMCGNFGDPIIARDTLEVYTYFRENNPNMSLSMNTNGSARKPEWWSNLAHVIGKNGYVVYGIDGLADTNHIYRKDTNFEKIIENAKAFIDFGGQAHWDFIVFEHNEHQIEEAKKFSEQIGFKQFRIKKTGRFFSNEKMKTKNFHEVHNKKGEVMYKIHPPKDLSLQNRSLQKETKLIEKHGNMKNYLNQTPISCKVLLDKSIYISADGNVFPCCWTANQMYVWFMPKQGSEIWRIIDEIGGVENINAKNLSIKEIVEGKFFQKIEDSWSINSIEHGRLKTCAKTCGEDFDQFRDQYR